MRPLIVTTSGAQPSLTGVSTASEFSSAEREAGRLLFAQQWQFATAAGSLESRVLVTARICRARLNISGDSRMLSRSASLT